MRLVDTHCHLQDEKFAEDREAVFDRSLEAVEWLVLIGNDLESSEAGVDLIRKGVYAAVGFHPYHGERVDDDTLRALRILASRPGVVAVGEIGLDYYKYNETPRAIQHEAFCRQLDLAVELGLPVVIHNRESDEDLGDILETYSRSLRGGVMHCFAGDEAFLKRCLSWGFYVSFAGNVTFPKAQALRDAAKLVPEDRLLVETDSPYLAPQPVRGKRCEPAYVRDTLLCIAETRGVAAEALAERTSENARRLFGVE